MGYTPSNDNCSINIYVQNKTGSQFSYQGMKRHHGKTVNNPSTIASNSPMTLIATLGKKSGYGPQEILKYSASDGTELYFYYNNPESGEWTTTFSEQCQYFYVIIKPPQGKGTTFYAEVSNYSMDPAGVNETQAVMNPNVTIYSS